MALIATTGLALIAAMATYLARSPIHLTTASITGDEPASYVIISPVRLPLPIEAVIERGVVRFADRPDRALPSSIPARMVLDNALIVLALPQPRDRAGPLPGPTVGSAIGVTEADLVPVLAALSQLSFEGLDVRRSTIRIVTESGKSRIIDEVDLKIAVKAKATATVSGSFQHAGRRLTIDAILGLTSNKPGWAGIPLKLTLKGAGLDIAVDGRLALDSEIVLDGPAELNAIKVRKLATILGFALPTDLWPRNLKVKGNLRWSPRGFAFDRATFAADNNSATGALSIAVAGERPAVQGTLAFEMLELAGFPAALFSGHTRSGTRDVLDVDVTAPLLRHFDADVRLSASQLTIGKLTLGRAAATVALKAGRLLADIAEIELGSGQATGQISIDVTQPATRVSMRGKLVDSDISALIGADRSRMSLDGRTNVVMDVHAAGTTAGDLVRSLGGKVTVTMPSGGRMGIDGRAAVALAQGQDIYGWTAPLRSPTVFDQLELRLVGSDGQFRLEAAKIKIGDTMLVGDGSIDTKRQSLDLRVIASGTDVAPREAGAVTRARLAVGIAASVAGPWWSPAIRAIRRLAQPVTEVGVPDVAADPDTIVFVPRDPG